MDVGGFAVGGLTVGVGLAAIGLLVAMWGHIRSFASNIASLVVINVSVGRGASDAVAMYILRHFRRIRMGDIAVVGRNQYVRPVQQNQLIAMKVFPSKGTCWFKGWRPLWVKNEWGGLKISFIRGMFGVNSFVFDAVQGFNELKKLEGEFDRFFITRKQGTVGEKLSTSLKNMNADKESTDDTVYHEGLAVDKYNSEIIGWKFDDVGQPRRDDAVEMLSLTQEAVDAYNDILDWRKREEWYKSHLIPWKLGWLLAGIPGTGKTAFARAVGQACNMPIFILDLASMTNSDFVEAWEQVMDWSPCIVLIEDIHAVYEGPKRIADIGKEAGLTFDCLLNVLDGVENTDGIVTIITTNDVNVVDTTLGGTFGFSEDDVKHRRPGRIDRVVHFEVLDMAGREKMASRILDEMPESERVGAVVVGDGMTGAEFQDHCRRLICGKSLNNHDKVS